MSLLGAGGMGEVWRATDPALGRAVALKLLPAAFACDPERVARLEREAKLLASLSHPGIATLFGLERVDGTLVLVMELVEGEDLGQRLARGPIPLDEALPAARQVAEALEAAHEKGVVHRDLKPANVKVTPDGQVKILDFGLAKGGAADETAASSPADSSQSPTAAHTGTAAGIILGTAAYMSPEQARGRAVDRRTDIWAFGVLLHEMLTGRRLFAGETVSDTLAAVLTRQPDWEALPAGTPPAVRQLLARCLERDPRRRLRDIGEARVALELTKEPALPGAAARSRGGVLRAVVPWLFLLVAAGAGLAAGWLLPHSTVPSRLVRASLLPPAGTEFFFDWRQPGSPSLSVDGRYIAFGAESAKGDVRLWVQELATGVAQPLSGTENGSYPFWSPDGSAIGFFADGKLKRIAVGTAAPQTLADAPFGKGGSWSAKGEILFAQSYDSGIYRIAADGGPATPVTRVDRGRSENSHRFPQFLPDGRHFLFLARVSGDAQVPLNEVMVASVDGGAPKALLRAPTNVAFAAGHLLYVRDRALVARRFDPRSLRLEGDERVLAESVHLIPAASLGVFSASSSGVLAYDPNSGGGSMQLVWLDRSGREVGTLGDPGDYYEERLSPDGRRVALTAEDPKTGRQDVWIVDVASGARTRLTLGKSDGSFPVWYPDGRHVVFRARERGYLDLYERDLDSEEERLLLRTDEDKLPTSVSPDGRFLAYLVSLGRRGIWMLPLQGGGAPFLFRSSDSPQENAQFSPDGRWIAFEQTESVRKDVYVTSFPKPGPAWRVSADGGETPRWSSDGRAIFFLSSDNRLMASTVMPRGPELEIGPPRLVGDLSVRVSGIATGHGAESNYDVRGDRYLVLGARSARTRPLSLLLDWTALTR